MRMGPPSWHGLWMSTDYAQPFSVLSQFQVSMNYLAPMDSMPILLLMTLGCYFEEIRVLKTSLLRQVYALNALTWDNIIRLWSYYVGLHIIIIMINMDSLGVSESLDFCWWESSIMKMMMSHLHARDQSEFWVKMTHLLKKKRKRI